MLLEDSGKGYSSCSHSKALPEAIPEHPTSQNSRRQLRSAVLLGIGGWGEGGYRGLTGIDRLVPPFPNIKRLYPPYSPES